MKLNPILQKELKVGSRSMRMSWTIMGVNMILSLVVFLVMLSLENNTMYGYPYQDLLKLFPTLSVIECGILSLIVPIMTSGSISGERERQTLDIMLTTPMKPMKIIWGKLQATMIVVLMYMISSMPILAVPLIYGGISWGQMLQIILLLFYVGIYVGSVGIFCSSLVKKSVVSSILTLAIGIVLVVGTIVGFALSVIIKLQNAGNANQAPIGFSAVWLLPNPYAPFIEVFLQMERGIGFAQFMNEIGKSVRIMQKIYKVWIPVTVSGNLAVAYGFLRLAAVRLNPGEKKRK